MTRAALRTPAPAGYARVGATHAAAWSAIVLDSLVLWPSDTPSRAAADALARMGMRVREWAHDDLASLLAVAHQAALAPAASAEIVRWLQERAAAATPPRALRRIDPDGGVPDAAGGAPGVATAARLEAATSAVLALSAADARPWMRVQAGGVRVRERIVAIGHASERELPLLVGVLSERDGPHRMWVPYARQRAAQGDAVLRLDMAGIGDSARQARPDRDRRPDHYDARCVDDIARAVAWLRSEQGVADVTVMGVCSGAYLAWHAALAGADVQQVVAINPPIFHWRTDLWLDPAANAFGQIAISANAARSPPGPARWRKLLKARADIRVIARAAAARARHALRLRVRDLARAMRLPLEHDLAAELARVCARGVSLDFVFSARDPGLTLMREEAGLRGMRPARDSRVTVCVVDRADHTFAGSAGRAALYARLDSLLPPLPSMSPTPVASSSRQPATARS